MTMLYVQLDHVNLTERYRLEGSEVYESCCDTRGYLFRIMRSEYGRCTGRVLVTTQGGDRQVGWVFVKRQKYDDSDDTFLMETWVTVHMGPPTKTIEYHYAA